MSRSSHSFCFLHLSRIPIAKIDPFERLDHQLKKKGGIAEKKEEKKKKPKAKKEAELVRVSTPERGSLPSELEPSSCKCKMLVGICYRIISNCPYHAKLLAFR